MRCGAYYNEIDPFAAAWLRELMNDGLIAPGEIDTRSIEDVRPADLRPFRQCHFFAGIGVWSLAARQAGILDDTPLWTGSCPCQPFSAAGKGGGFADERHLWPAFHHLIRAERPERVVGEQVASKDGLAWLDLVQTDMEAEGYAFGAVDTCAAGFGAPHIRQRTYWVAAALLTGRAEGRSGPGGGSLTARSAPSLLAESMHAQRRPLGVSGADGRDGQDNRRQETHGDTGTCGEIRGLADAHGGDAGAERQQRSGQQRQQPEDGSAGELAHAAGGGLGELRRTSVPRRSGYVDGGVAPFRPGPTNGLWANPDWLLCRDQKWRPVEPGTFPLADAGTFRNRIPALRGAGNAINLAQATAFLEAIF